VSRSSFCSYVPFSSSAVEAENEVPEFVRLLVGEDSAAELLEHLRPDKAGRVLLSKLHVAHVDTGLVQVGLLKQDVQEVCGAGEARFQCGKRRLSETIFFKICY
jgi:hypothetical protein